MRGDILCLALIAAVSSQRLVNRFNGSPTGPSKGKTPARRVPATKSGDGFAEAAAGGASQDPTAARAALILRSRQVRAGRRSQGPPAKPSPAAQNPPIDSLQAAPWDTTSGDGQNVGIAPTGKGSKKNKLITFSDENPWENPGAFSRPAPSRGNPRQHPRPQPRQQRPTVGQTNEEAWGGESGRRGQSGPPKWVPQPPPSRPSPAVGSGQCGSKPDWTPCETEPQAADRIRRCCVETPGVDEGCYEYCKIDVTPAEMVKLGKGTPECSLSAAKKALKCVAGGNDYTECCVDKDVRSWKCRRFCDPSRGIPELSAIEGLKCLKYLKKIRSCYLTYKPL